MLREAVGAHAPWLETRSAGTAKLLLLGAAALLAAGLLALQLRYLTPAYLEGEQLLRHRAVLNGYAGNPWQYRLFSDYLAEGLLRAAAALGAKHPAAVGFLALRFLQNVAVLVLAALYYRRLGLSRSAVGLGLAILGWAISHSYLASDLSFNTYFDIGFYLVAALLISRRRDAWILPLVVVAALNRETSGLIPFMLAAEAMADVETRRRRGLLLAAASLALFALIFVTLRLAFPGQELIEPYGVRPGIDLVRFNLGNSNTWLNLIATLSLVPLLAVVAMRSWPATLRRLFWVLVPAWLAIHLVGSAWSETRLFLVPFTLVLLPGALLPLERVRSRASP